MSHYVFTRVAKQIFFSLRAGTHMLLRGCCFCFPFCSFRVTLSSAVTTHLRLFTPAHPGSGFNLSSRLSLGIPLLPHSLHPFSVCHNIVDSFILGPTVFVRALPILTTFLFMGFFHCNLLSKFRHLPFMRSSRFTHY